LSEYPALIVLRVYLNRYSPIIVWVMAWMMSGSVPSGAALVLVAAR